MFPIDDRLATKWCGESMKPGSRIKWKEALRCAVRETIEEACKAVSKEKVELIGEGDAAYNTALVHAVSAIRALLG